MDEQFTLGVSLPVRALQEDIGRRRGAMWRLEREERRKLLEEHQKRWSAAWATLHADCAAIGHDWKDLPENGVNRPHFITGEWPQKCSWCGISKRHSDSASEQS